MGNILDKMFEKTDELLGSIKGGQGSGNWGHKGRKGGRRGGSLPRNKSGGTSSPDVSKEEVNKVQSSVEQKLSSIVEKSISKGMSGKASDFGFKLEKTQVIDGKPHFTFRSKPTDKRLSGFQMEQEFKKAGMRAGVSVGYPGGVRVKQPAVTELQISVREW